MKSKINNLIITKFLRDAVSRDNKLNSKSAESDVNQALYQSIITMLSAGSTYSEIRVKLGCTRATIEAAEKTLEV